MKLAGAVAVFIGAGIGGALRYALGEWITDRWGASFPWHTLVINVAGAFLLGLLMALSVDRGLVSASTRLFLGVGVLGGFTTFSALAYESIVLFERGLLVQGSANLLGSVVLGAVAVIAGLLVGQAV
ncbi:MAG: fluoride efflux transporter CrcB [Coriobacteriia bacterium]|nr:fluoride efflux transporter CrcB [Coriobacteriia bacterium]